MEVRPGQSRVAIPETAGPKVKMDFENSPDICRMTPTPIAAIIPAIANGWVMQNEPLDVRRNKGHSYDFLIWKISVVRRGLIVKGIHFEDIAVCTPL